MTQDLKPKELKEARETMGLSQEQMAKDFGYAHRTQINFMERGERPVTITKEQLIDRVVKQIKKLQVLRKKLLTK